MRFGLGVYLFFTVLLPSKGQEKNYEVVSNMVNCEELPDKFKNSDEALRIISSATYRYQQNFKIRRKSGLKAGKFYSCDNKKGYLIIEIDDRFEIYIDVLKSDWQQLISSNDPKYLLESLIRVKYLKL